MAALAQREVIALRIDALLGDVDTLISQLDRIDADADLEPEEDFGADDVGENRTWPEYEYQDHIGQHATASAPLEDDVELNGDELDGDYGSEDEFMLYSDREGGAGCPFADPGGCQHDGREVEDGV